MKRLLIVPILALAMAALAPAAYANHGGAQSPDIDERDEECQTAFVGHASCTATHPTPAALGIGITVAGVPTADGWHVAFDHKRVANDTDAVLDSGAIDVTVPYTWNFANEDELFEGSPAVPLPSQPTYGLGALGGANDQTTNGTCSVDVIVGSGGELICAFR